jgi:hypothetical protein
MQHSTWDLEVHVREMQTQRLREATRARQIEGARFPGGRGPFSGPRSIFARLVSLAESWLSFQWGLTVSPVERAVERDQVESALARLPVEEPRFNTVTPSTRLSDPYAGMAVVARGITAQTTEQPCAVGDC